MNKILVCLIAANLLPISAHSQQSHPRVVDLVEHVRPAVVQINVRFTEPESLTDAQKASLTEGERNCFGFHYCIAGTGFFVNAEGDIVTAAHVAMALQDIVARLRSAGAKADFYVGVSRPNVENARVVISSSTEEFPIALVATDITHDLALFHPPVNPFRDRHGYVAGLSADLIHPKLSFVKLGTQRPRDAEDVFACGFPFATPGMVTNPGTIGSAWKDENLLTAKANGVAEPIEVFQADLSINPGNSGGPVFRVSDQAVIGVVVELHGTLDTVVPAKFVAKFLTDYKVLFSSVDAPSVPNGR
jgi:S1-C subfamily serine protease